MSGISLRGVSKSFGDVEALKALDLEVEEGEFVSILGPSGCGKTTLLRMLAGLEQPTAGEISIGGDVVTNMSPSERNIAMVFQSYALYPHMTVAGNIEYPLKKRGVTRAERAERVNAAAAMLQLEDLLKRKPRELSGGQQQRVALGRAVVRDPAVFLMDEPLSNLDAKLRAHMRAELIQLHRRIGRTTIYVTHDQLEAMTMSSRIAILNDGELQQIDTPARVYSEPANEFVAGFIGMPPMNLVDATLNADGSVDVNGAGRWRFGFRDETAPTPAGPMRVGFRPEDIVVDPNGEAARVTVVEPTGHEVIVVFDVAGAQFVGRMSPETAPSVDDTVNLGLRAERMHVFSTRHGGRVGSLSPLPGGEA
jgi:multiple sugar transport system ATP-binding protein